MDEVFPPTHFMNGFVMGFVMGIARNMFLGVGATIARAHLEAIRVAARRAQRRVRDRGGVLVGWEPLPLNAPLERCEAVRAQGQWPDGQRFRVVVRLDEPQECPW